MEAPRIKEVKVKTHKTLKIDGFKRVPPTPPLNANALFGRSSLSLTLFMTKLSVPVLSFLDFADTSTMRKYIRFKKSG